MIWVYRLLVQPVMVLSLPLLALVNRKVRQGLGLRLRAGRLPGASTRPLWIHAASGEFEYAKAVIRECKGRWPGVPIVVTYFSPSYAKAVAGFPGVDAALPLPLDLPGPCASLIRRLKPRALLIARTDFWPELLHQARTRGVPALVFSYTQKDLRQASWLKRTYTRWRLTALERVFCVSDADREALQGLGVSALVSGDTRYDQVAYRLAHPKTLEAHLRPRRPALVAGSTWAEDEAVLLPACAEALKADRLQLILVPHEPTPAHIQKLERQLDDLGLSHQRFSDNAAFTAQVLLVDRVGVLAELYLWGTFAFVGGSFKGSVHSVMEALGAGCLTFVGPYHQNNREALEFAELTFAGIPGIHTVKSAAEFRTALNGHLEDPTSAAEFAEKLGEEFARRLGASRRLADQLAPYLNRDS